ncbi:putative F420-0 ABC transporter permease subunit [Paenarthrobacter sp.]|uniref:putative F420-0 ABC transporter permease subunit n=1 Tax=Paenarthrobacter sp. TaxID=1931993 RepID=UPI002811ACC7|nr:putative F420-0 ABC transporter permease subunit [Paenarthrobacter sp.]
MRALHSQVGVLPHPVLIPPDPESTYRIRKRKLTLVLLLLLAILLLSLAAAAAVGPTYISPAEVLAAVAEKFGAAGPDPSKQVQNAIIWELRLPRVVTAAVVGAGLAVGGVVMQGLTRNPLADPYLLGVSSGASLAAVSVLLLGVALLLPLAAFAGALAAMAIALGLASSFGRLSTTRTVLAGLAVSSLASSLTSFVIFWTAQGDSYREVLSWLMGSLSGSTWSSVGIAIVGFLLAGVPILLTGRMLDAFAFGDSAASSLGLNPTRIRWAMMGAVALLTGCMVAVSGALGFVGLVIPHVVRLLAGAGHRTVLPLSAFTGAIFLIWADTVARSVLSPREIPVGVITALVGAPAFAFLIWRQKRGT